MLRNHVELHHVKKVFNNHKNISFLRNSFLSLLTRVLRHLAIIFPAYGNFDRSFVIGMKLNLLVTLVTVLKSA